jgi:hypothetical protein
MSDMQFGAVRKRADKSESVIEQRENTAANVFAGGTVLLGGTGHFGTLVAAPNGISPSIAENAVYAANFAPFLHFFENHFQFGFFITRLGGWSPSIPF